MRKAHAGRIEGCMAQKNCSNRDQARSLLYQGVGYPPCSRKSNQTSPLQTRSFQATRFCKSHRGQTFSILCQSSRHGLGTRFRALPQTSRMLRPQFCCTLSPPHRNQSSQALALVNSVHPRRNEPGHTINVYSSAAARNQGSFASWLSVDFNR